jgi:hypothetical protein
MWCAAGTSYARQADARLADVRLADVRQDYVIVYVYVAVCMLVYIKGTCESPTLLIVGC